MNGGKYELVVVIVNHGYSDELIESAREAGAMGGTVVSARGITHRGPVKFFGITVQEEKDIIIILTGKENKLAIMHALTQTYGITSNAAGLVFSLPVDEVSGDVIADPAGPDLSAEA